MELKKNKVIAEVVYSVVGRGTGISKYIKKAIKILENEPKIRIFKHPMGTVIEADNFDEIINVVKKGHEAIFNEGVDRVVTRLTIDDRRDKPRLMEDKIRAIE